MVKVKLEDMSCAMAAGAVQPVMIRIQEDRTCTVGKIARGVSQGSLLSLTLFNVYMDIMVEWLRLRIPYHIPARKMIAAWNIALFADDVKAQAADEQVLQ